MFRYVLMLVFLVPVPLIAQTGSGERQDVRKFSMAQLCTMKDSPEYLAELKSRDELSRRELRAIAEERIVTGMRDTALICLMGPPEQIYSVRTQANRDLVDAYLYSADGEETLVVHVRHRSDESTVVRAFTTTGSVENWDFISPARMGCFSDGTRRGWCWSDRTISPGMAGSAARSYRSEDFSSMPSGLYRY